MHLRLQYLRFLSGRQILALVAVVLLLCAVLLGVFLDPKAQAATASTINFQARLMNDSGSIAPDGFYNVEFKIYNTESTGATAQGVCTGNCVWMETRTSGDTVRVVNGYLTVSLGSVTALGASIPWDQELWLTMNVGGIGTPSWDGEMTPRLKLTAVPYAFAAGQLVGAAGSNEGVLEFDSFGQNSTITLPDPGGASATICYQGDSNCGFVAGATTDFIQNSTSLQANANFNIQSASAGSVGGIIRAASGQTANIFEVQDDAGGALMSVGPSAIAIGGSGTNAAITLQSGTGTINIGTGNQARSVNIGTGAAAQTVTIGSTDTTSETIIQGGSGGIEINAAITTINEGDLHFQSEAVASQTIWDSLDAPTTVDGADSDAVVVGVKFQVGTTGFIKGVRFYKAAANTGTHTGKLWTDGGSELASVTFSGETSSGWQEALFSSPVAVSPGTTYIASYHAPNGHYSADGAYFATDPTTNGYLTAIQSAGGNNNGVFFYSSSHVFPSDSFNATNYWVDVVFEPAGGGLNNITASGGLVVTAATELVLRANSGAVSVGQTDTTGTLFVLDTMTGDTDDPTTTLNGAMYYNSEAGKFRCYENDAWKDCIGAGNGSVFAQGGNDFDADAVLGTTDADNLIIITDNTTRATFDTNNHLYLGNGTTATSPNDFTIQGTGSSTAATNGGALTVVGGTGNTSGTGGAVTIQGGAGGNAATGGAVTIQGGAAGGGNTNGANVTITGGAGAGSGVLGLVNLAPTRFISSGSTQTFDSGSGCPSCSVTGVDTYSTIAINADVSGLSIGIPVPNAANQVVGRILYVTAVNGSEDFTIVLGGTSIQIAMKANSTATLIWNGTGWTAAGASSSTDLQSAYNNTLTSAGGAELLLNAPGGNADGLTIRNNGDDPIVGGLLEVQNSIGSNLFSVNNNATEYATNGGAETAGSSSSTFPSNTWDTTTGGTVDRWTTPGSDIATGQASVRVQTTSTNHGARNRLSAALTSGLTYTVSFAVRDGANFNTLQVLYSPDGTTSGTTQCTTGQTVTSGIWKRITCNFDASGTITSSNSILIRQTDATARTFYIDNLSVTVDASATYAADGSVDDVGNFATNWTDYATSGSTVGRESTVIFDTSGSARAALTANAGIGLRNNLAITPQTNTQYLVTFYMRSTTAMSGTVRVGFLPAGGTGAPSGTAACTDYNTQSLTADTWTEITCLFTTEATSITNPDLVIYQSDASARTMYVDALSITLNTNNSNNVQVGGANRGGPVTLFTLDRSNGAPIAANNEAYLGSMYYDTESGRIQCYEADGWGACGAAPDNIVNLNPEYPGAVLNGGSTPGVGTMSADFCGNGGGLTVNTSLCASGEARNFYEWTSPQPTMQTYSIYVSYQLPATFNGFASDDTVQLVARVDDTDDAEVTYEMFRSTGSTVTQCGSGETDVIAGDGDTADVWHRYGINGNEATGCGLNSSAAGDFIIFKINLKARSNANAYVSTLSFTTTGR